VLDFGKNLSGLPKLSVSGPGGTTVTLIPAETANADGTINVSSTGVRADRGQILYRYTLSGDDRETWHSQFTYNGFRYLQVSGLTEAPTTRTVTTLVTHASNRETASFDSSSELLNSIYDITRQALENNMQSVLTDCPDREKGPYTGDNLHNIDTELTLFDMQAYQGQLVNNMRTAQRPTPFNGEFPGLIANIAPEYHFVIAGLLGGNWFLDEPNWGGAVIRIPWQLYRVYGDTRAMRENYAAMVKWLDYEAATKAANGGNIRGLGDWSSAQTTDRQAVIDYGYYEGVSTMVKVAQVLGNAADVDKYSQLAASLADEYNAKYLHTDDAGRAWYANNTQASNAVALDAGLVPPQYHQAVVDSLVQSVAAFGNRIGTGSVALGAALPDAARRGPRRSDLRDGEQPRVAGLRLPGRLRQDHAHREPRRRRLAGSPLPGPGGLLVRARARRHRSGTGRHRLRPPGDPARAGGGPGSCVRHVRHTAGNGIVELDARRAG
jgi:hypothetical protein